MATRRMFQLQDIARTNYHWNESKTRINLVLSSTLLIALFFATALL